MDITMCHGVGCPVKGVCERCMGDRDVYQYCFSESPYDHKMNTCVRFRPWGINLVKCSCGSDAKLMQSNTHWIVSCTECSRCTPPLATQKGAAKYWHTRMGKYEGLDLEKIN